MVPHWVSQEPDHEFASVRAADPGTRTSIAIAAASKKRAAIASMIAAPGRRRNRGRRAVVRLELFAMGILDGWRTCPRCSHELEQRERGHLACPDCGSQFWANSAPAVQGLLERDGRLLLARRAIEPGVGLWDIPGGFLEEGEEALDGLRREFAEETGIEIEPVEWLGASIDPYDGYFVLGLSWLVRGEGEPRAADDVAELAWFSADELPDEMAFPSQAGILRRWASR
jgi:ADP-ribose pyrophosphatase YjhB (NUDIX family)